MKSINILIAMIVLLSFSACNSQINNPKTENVKIYGNCGMCESKIEKAGNVKKVAKVDWDKETKMAKITYDPSKTNKEDILKRIALAGYDSDQFLAPDDVYANLHGCCQYDRVKKTENLKENQADISTNMSDVSPQASIETGQITKEDHSDHKTKVISDKKTLEKDEVKVDHSTHKLQVTTPAEPSQEINQLKSVFENYFSLKDALVKTDGTLASSKAKSLVISLDAVQMNKLSHEEHVVWMKVMKDLKFDADHIEETKDVSHQREHFNGLSDNMYQLLKVSKQETPTYFQHCPMANEGKGANWLSKENAVKNPYYGNEMLTCGKVVEIIK